MKFSVISLFPDLIHAATSTGLIGQAREKNLVEVATINPRQFTTDNHHTVDDRVFGGGDGMVMKTEPLVKAVESLGPARVVVLSPQGRRWDQALAAEWAREGKHTVLICGRYAGIDHRFTVTHADCEISLGDFVLNGGELAACAVIETVTRLLPEVLGNDQSAVRDSFSDGLLECPQFTRPRDALGLPVPAPLLSGNHAKIKEFERAVSLVRTRLLRPDLIASWGAEGERAVKVVAALGDDELRSLGLKRADLEGLLP